MNVQNTQKKSAVEIGMCENQSFRKTKTQKVK